MSTRAVPPAVQAHRGSPDPATGVVENTVEAFLRAGRLGADGVELDVRLTADGALAVHHDPVVAGLGPIADLRVRQLPDHVPLLAAALDACGDLVVNIEVKNLPTEPGHDPAETAARMVAALVVESGLVDRVVVSSFWPGSLDAVSAVDPSVPTGLLLAGWADPAWGLEEAGERGCRALHAHRSLVTAELVEAAHRVGLAVATWTVDGAAEVAAMAGLGVDTVITDDVASAVAALAGIPSEPSDPVRTAGHQGV
jgi:glycerophosphoryl diester phosphodiesterase